MKRQSYKKGPRFGPEAYGYVEDLNKPVQQTGEKLSAPTPAQAPIVEKPVFVSIIEDKKLVAGGVEKLTTVDAQKHETEVAVVEQETVSSETLDQNVSNLRDKKKK